MAAMNSSFLRRLFWILNKFFMVPMFRLGLGPIVGNPISGYIMVIKTTGRKTGKKRYTPVNYAIYQGDLYCMAGWGQISDWYRNILANRNIEVIHPDGPLAGTVDEVTDPVKRIAIMRAVLKNAGFAGFFEGFNPFRVTDEELERKLGSLPLLRIHPVGLGSGASDPAGWAWIWTVLLIVLLSVILGIIL
jgi:deazaflavin-dependent oxidoreductase (nitroreductase family)